MLTEFKQVLQVGIHHFVTRCSSGMLLVIIGDRQSPAMASKGRYMMPYLEPGEYDQGIWDGYKAIMRVVSAEYGIAVP